MESAAARVCREAGGRVSANVFVRDLDTALPDRADERRIEVIADGLPLFHGAQLPIDTLVSPLSRDGAPYARCVNRVELHLPRRDAARNSAIPNWREIMVARGWWSSPAKCVADGLRRAELPETIGQGQDQERTAGHTYDRA